MGAGQVGGIDGIVAQDGDTSLSPDSRASMVGCLQGENALQAMLKVVQEAIGLFFYYLLK